MFYFQCKRCNHITKQKVEMKRHLDRKFKCIKKISSYKFDDIDLYNNSLIRHFKNNENEIEEELKNALKDALKDELNEEFKIKEEPEQFEKIPFENNDLKEFKEYKEFKKYKELKKNIESINKNDDNSSIASDISDEYSEYSFSTQNQDGLKFICTKCNKFFKNKSNLNRHINKNRCISNITNINGATLNQQNNIININLKIMRPFDDDWDTSQIDSTLKNLLLLSNMKYTKTLEHILSNESNLNVIIEDDLNNGIVYKNDTEKFKQMTITDIVDKSMDKLHKHLQNFHNEINEHNDFNINKEYLEEEKDIIQQKYDEYKSNKYVKSKVQEFITNIYNSKKKETIQLYQDLLTDVDKNLIEGY